MSIMPRAILENRGAPHPLIPPPLEEVFDSSQHGDEVWNLCVPLYLMSVVQISKGLSMPTPVLKPDIHRRPL